MQPKLSLLNDELIERILSEACLAQKAGMETLPAHELSLTMV